MIKKSLKPIALGVLLLGGSVLSVATGFALNGGENGNGTQVAPLHVQVDNTPLVRDVKEGNSFAPIVKKVAPSVVKIFVTMKVNNPSTNSDMDFFRRFFGGEGLNPLNPGRSP